MLYVIHCLPCTVCHVLYTMYCIVYAVCDMLYAMWIIYSYMQNGWRYCLTLGTCMLNAPMDSRKSHSQHCQRVVLAPPYAHVHTSCYSCTGTFTHPAHQMSVLAHSLCSICTACRWPVSRAAMCHVLPLVTCCHVSRAAMCHVLLKE